MPTFRCTAPRGQLDTERRAAIAREIPRIYQAVTGVAADFTLVISHRATAQPLDKASSAASDHFETAEIRTDDNTIFIRRYGNGSPLLMIHGFPRTSLMWRDMAPRRSPRPEAVCGTALSRTATLARPVGILADRATADATASGSIDALNSAFFRRVRDHPPPRSSNAFRTGSTDGPRGREGLEWVTGCRDDYIDLMAGVPQIAADLLPAKVGTIGPTNDIATRVVKVATLITSSLVDPGLLA
jgi:hypothetical protein